MRMITKVHCDAESSTESLRDFKDSASNHDLLEGIITQLDDKTLSGIKRHWKHLGQKFKISCEKLEVIEFCAPYNPTKSLMEYLLVKEEDLTMRTFYEKVRQKFQREDVLKILEPFLEGDSDNGKLLKNVINLDSECMDKFYVCLNKKNPALQNWKDLAQTFNISRDVYRVFDQRELNSPTKQLFEWLFVNRTELTLRQLCRTFRDMNRNDLRRDIEKVFGNIALCEN